MEDFILELVAALLGFLLEALLEIGAEVLFDLAWRAMVEVLGEKRIENPTLAFLGYGLLGLVTGGFSLLIFPHPLVHPSRIHGISLLVSPILAGLAMSLIGFLFRRQHKKAIQIESFGYGFVFAFGIASVRFLFTR